MTTFHMGYESVETILRRRGHVVVGKGNIHQVLVPLETVAAQFGWEPVGRFVELFGNSTFRKVLRKLTASRDVSVRINDLQKIAGKRTDGYVDLLTSLKIAERLEDGVKLTRDVDNIGPTLEWYVAQLCERELWCSASWGVKLEGLPTGGDYDVLAWLDPTLMYVELKSSHPSQVPDDELKQFLQRSVELAPDLAILLIDTDSSLADLLERLNELMLPVIRVASGIQDPSWRPLKPFIRPQTGFAGVSFGYRRIYVTNSCPKILTQLRRCLQHYHARVKGSAFWGGPPVNFVTGEVGDEQ